MLGLTVAERRPEVESLLSPYARLLKQYTFPSRPATTTYPMLIAASDDSSHPSLAWTNWPLFTVGMVQRGFKDDDIRKILGGNVLRVARANAETWH